MTYEFARALERDNMDRGEWFPVTAEGRLTARVACPECGQVATLDHDILADGTVTPSLDCPVACGLHEDGRLLDWVAPRQLMKPLHPKEPC